MATGYLEARFDQGTPNVEAGTGPYSSKQIFMPVLSFQPSPNPSHLMRDDELRGVDQPLTGLSEAYRPTWSGEARGYPDTLGFALSLALGAPTTTAGNGTITDLHGSVIPSGAYRHQWAAPFLQGVYPQAATFRVGYADQTTFYALRGATADTLSVTSPETGGVRVQMSGPSLTMERIADPSLSATYEALSIPPFMRSNLTLPAWLANTSTTEDFSFTITNPVEVTSSLGIASKFPDLLERAAGPVTVTGSIPKRQLGTADYDALINATAFSGTATWLSTTNIGTTSFPYKMIAAFDALQYTEGGPQALANQRRIGQDLTFRASYDGSGTSVIFQLVNATSSYS